ncbi:MAG: GNAT family N-acetyltransferase [Dyadobacter sp.]
MNLKLTDKTIQLRKIKQDDLSVLREIYGTTRQLEMDRVPHWTDLMKSEFIKQQFQAQHSHYQNNYPEADFWILERNNNVIGRLYVEDNSKQSAIRIIDITLLPEFRGKGSGTGILKDLIQKASDCNLPLSIHVESFNPAKRLYERLGFKMISETNGVYHLMEWKNTI